MSSVGWVDHDVFWRVGIGASRPEKIAVGSGARCLTLRSSGSDWFSVGHHFDGTRFELTVHSFEDPAMVLSRATVRDGHKELAGDLSSWEKVPLLYVTYLRFEPWRDFVLLRILPSTGQIKVQRLEWYDNTYDKGYQGVLDVLELPDENVALISVQRSSRLILHDLDSGMQRGTVELAGRGGNPHCQLDTAGKEIWATDYDTIVILERSDRRVLRRARLQESRQFIGNFSFAPDQDVCVVARPFSGDVVGIDKATLRIRSAAKLGQQPLDVGALCRGEVIARDWKTGDFLRGKLKRKWLIA
jgi:hypothetical protein